MKRFTETTKWSDPWFRKLSPLAKLLFAYLVDNCDHAGVIDLDLEAAAFVINGKVEEKHLSELESRLDRLPDGKLWITGFVRFQCGKLSKECRPHIAVFQRLELHGIHIDRVNKPLTKGCQTLQDKEQDKEQDKDTDKEQEQDKCPMAEILEIWNSVAPVKCMAISDKRRHNLSARWKDEFFRDNWRVAIEKISESHFCNGGGETGWKASFDWFLQPDSVVKTIEGKYDAKRKEKLLLP